MTLQPSIAKGSYLRWPWKTLIAMGARSSIVSFSWLVDVSSPWFQLTGPVRNWR